MPDYMHSERQAGVNPIAIIGWKDLVSLLQEALPISYRASGFQATEYGLLITGTKLRRTDPLIDIVMTDGKRLEAISKVAGVASKNQRKRSERLRKMVKQCKERPLLLA